MKRITKLYSDYPKLIKLSFFISMIIILIGCINHINNNRIFNEIDNLLGPIGGLLSMLIFEPFGLIFTLLGLLIYPSEIWFYIGQTLGFFITGLMIFIFLKYSFKIKAKNE